MSNSRELRPQSTLDPVEADIATWHYGHEADLPIAFCGTEGDAGESLAVDEGPPVECVVCVELYRAYLAGEWNGRRGA